MSKNGTDNIVGAILFQLAGRGGRPARVRILSSKAAAIGS